MFYDESTKNLGLFFFVCDVPAETNLDDSSIPPIEQFYEQAENFMTATDELFLRLVKLENPSEVDIQTVFYDVGKEYYGTEGPVLRKWFRDLSNVWWKAPDFPRMGNFVALFGVYEFIIGMEKRINDPFGALSSGKKPGYQGFPTLKSWLETLNLEESEKFRDTICPKSNLFAMPKFRFIGE